jgi:hypothetical protein
MTAPGTADIVRIAGQPDDVIRNLAITQCYHELSTAVRAHTGEGANWCTFATWASKQAGQTIRKEDLAGVLRDRLGGVPDQSLAALASALRPLGIVRDVASLLGSVLRALEAGGALDRTAHAVAVGNRMVFEEIGLQFARFLGIIADGRIADARFADFSRDLRPGEPPHGQVLLREAFADYRQSLAEPDAKARAERMLRANLLIGLHEQTRLQPQIALALDAAFDPLAVRRRLLGELLPGAWRQVRHRLAAAFGRRPPLDDAIDALLGGVQRELRRVITAAAMTLHLPERRVIRLSRDMAVSYPASLAAITDPALAELLRRIDPIPGSTRGSGASDWADLDERVHLIAELFRGYHEWRPLFEPPFLPDQASAIRAGRRPVGPL